jgi:excisionase family DNA binding protein
MAEPPHGGEAGQWRVENFILRTYRPIKDTPVRPYPRAATVQRAALAMPSKQPLEADALLTPSEVATMFRVDPKTVTRWANDGRLTSVRTLGGHRRYLANEVRSLLSGEIPEQTQQSS